MFARHTIATGTGVGEISPTGSVSMTLSIEFIDFVSVVIIWKSRCW